MKSNSSRPIMTLSDAKDSISCLEIEGAELFVGSVDGRVRVYDIRMGRFSVDVIGRKCFLEWFEKKFNIFQTPSHPFRQLAESTHTSSAHSTPAFCSWTRFLANYSRNSYLHPSPTHPIDYEARLLPTTALQSAGLRMAEYLSGMSCLVP